MGLQIIMGNWSKKTGNFSSKNTAQSTTNRVETVPLNSTVHMQIEKSLYQLFLMQYF